LRMRDEGELVINLDLLTLLSHFSIVKLGFIVSNEHM
jgi:hypothetical protein